MYLMNNLMDSNYTLQDVSIFYEGSLIGCYQTKAFLRFGCIYLSYSFFKQKKFVFLKQISIHIYVYTFF